MKKVTVPTPNVGMRTTEFFAIVTAMYMFLVVSTGALRADEGRVEIRVVNSAGQLMPARAWVDAGGKRVFMPNEQSATPYANDSSFSFDGTFTMNVPSGEATVHVERGKEFRPVEIDVDVPDGGTAQKTIELKRWINMPEEGWYSADLHVHLGSDDARVLTQLALADDVHLVPAFTYWLRGREKTWQAAWPETRYSQPFTIDKQHLITRNNIEIERIERDAAPGGTIGATFLFNLNQPVTALRFGEHFPTDAALCRIAREHSPGVVMDSDKPSWAETVIGAALGQLDTVQVCHNHYYRLSTGPGGYGMMGPLAPGESNAAVGDGLFHRTNSLYYRFLNCGFRLGVSGGSAVGVKAMPTGFHRVYAKIDGPLTAEKMWAAIKAGRTFATTGPMLTFSANGEPIGAELNLQSDEGKPVSIRAHVRSIDELEALQIVHNGRIVASRTLLDELSQTIVDTKLDFELIPNRSGWICARVLYRAPDGLLRQAHTSPIYVTIDRKPIAFASDARYMLGWIDRLVAIAKSVPARFPDDEARDAVLATYGKARARYDQIVEAAQQNWQDN